MTGKEFNILITKLRPKLISFARGFVKGGPSTPEDMVQEATIKLWRSNELQQVRNIEALTIQILKNVCLDYIKLKKNSMEGLSPNFKSYSESDPAQQLESKDAYNTMLSHINSLPKDQMLAVRLRDVMGYQMSEIATILDTSEGNVRTLLSRGRLKLRDKLIKR